MPIYIHPANLIIEKRVIEEKYTGGIEQFRLKYINDQQEYNQEDDELFSVSRMNPDEFDLEDLTGNGLTFNAEHQTSSDFAILTRYGNALWKVDWLQDNAVFAWHKDCDPKLIQKARLIGEATVDDLEKAFENGQNPFKTIRK